MRFDINCVDAAHEQVGALPLEFVRRLTVSWRVHRCGRRTLAGHPCRNPRHATRPGVRLAPQHRKELATVTIHNGRRLDHIKQDQQ